ncbi:MAG: LON peptidase substrate-binding domain-containing protein [Gemmatimonadetes bacterium]|nr:LON peptidase substrate-binding domain-containing protein [Gemmatimonadota bacterium]
MARDLPIFPLPIVLFPGTSQPLHIFEPRYRQLLTDCLEGDRRFGIAYVAGDAGVDPAPKPGDCGCVVVIETTQALPDGRSNVLTRGERRFVLEAWLATDRPYRVARVAEFDDKPEDAHEAAQLAADVRADFARVAEALTVLTDRDSESVELPADPQRLSFHVAAALELAPEVKLQFLQIRSTTARLRRLAALLRPLAADAERRAAVRHRAKGNGKGGAHSKIEPVS